MIYVLTIDGLPACSLGCYGEQRYSTPNFDRIAAQSWVCNFYYANAELPAFRERPDVSVLHWKIPQLEWQTVRTAAENWLDEESFESIFEEDETGSADEVIATMRAVLSPVQVGLIEATAVALSHDHALGQWLEGMSFTEQDLLVIVGRTGNLSRQADTRPDWLAAVSESMVHLPLIIYQPEIGEHTRIDELLQTDDLTDLITLASEARVDVVSQWAERVTPKMIRWETPEVIAVRNQDWLIVESREGTSESDEQERVMLFRKPEDLWDVLDLAQQFPALIEDYERTGLLPDAKGVTF